MEEIKREESWNKTRIFAVLFLVLLLAIGGYFFKTRVLDTKLSSSQPSRSVKGTSVEENNKEKKGLNALNVQKALQEKLEDLKQEVASLNILEVASSSSQIQKIINDIKSLEQYPTNQAKEICRQICGL